MDLLPVMMCKGKTVGRTNSSGAADLYTIRKADDILELIDYLSSFPLKTKKHKSYLFWLETREAIFNKNSPEIIDQLATLINK